jgi:hypothetical protein
LKRGQLALHLGIPVSTQDDSQGLPGSLDQEFLSAKLRGFQELGKPGPRLSDSQHVCLAHGLSSFIAD